MRGVVAIALAVVLAACSNDSPATRSPSGLVAPSSMASGAPAMPTPSGPAPATTLTSPSSTSYVVVSGDTIASIAARNGLSVPDLLAANPGVVPDRLAIGDRLVVPTVPYKVALTVVKKGGEASTTRVEVRLRESVILRAVTEPSLAGEELRFLVVGPDDPPPSIAVGSDGVAERELGSEGASLEVRAVILASSRHPVLVSNAVTVKWGGSGPCPEQEREQTVSAAAPDGTRYSLVPGVDAGLNVQWTVEASDIGGSPGPGWRQQLERCWHPELLTIAADGTAFVLLRLPSPGDWDPAKERVELLTAGPEGVRGRRALPRDSSIIREPNGLVYALTYDVDYGNASTLLGSSVALLGTDGKPRPGWPYASTGSISEPLFYPDGTLYLAESVASGNDRIVALGRDGRARKGWPYVVPGALALTACGDGCFDVPRKPQILEGGWIADAFQTGIYVVGPDGRPRPGWPYVLPRGTYVASSGHCDTPGGGMFTPAFMGDLRTYLPRWDQRTVKPHSDLTCVLTDGSLCPGWPVRLPGEKGIDSYSVASTGLEVGLGCGGTRVSIRPNGTMYHRVTVGETLSSIADGYEMSVEELLAANPSITDRSFIRTGQILEIPQATA